MFDSIHLPHQLGKEEFIKVEEGLREQLLDAQFALAEQKRATVLVIIGGSDGAGKGEVLNRLYDWLDDHYLETLTYGPPTEEERLRPNPWRYWRDLPAKGRIGLMLGSWHHGVLRDRAMGRMDRETFRNKLDDIDRVETMLRQEGVLIVKIWLYLDEKDAQDRLTEARETNGAWRRPVVLEWEGLETRKERARLNKAALEVAEVASAGVAPWVVVPADEPRYRDAAAAELLLETLKSATESAPMVSTLKQSVEKTEFVLPRPNIVAALDLTQNADPETYGKDLRQLQHRLTELTTAKSFRDRGLIVAFEGNDAAGKGGAIRRVREALDPRRFRVYGIAAPTDEEAARPYLWRFWRRAPQRGHVAIFDRSWYGRVLVERVEAYCREEDWRRAYQEINDFERQLSEANYAIVKFWLAISKDEQIARFESREAKATKRYKLTPNDWRNREKWPLYERAATDMVDRTSTRSAPWTLVEADDKKFARLKVLKTIIERLEA